MNLPNVSSSLGRREEERRAGNADCRWDGRCTSDHLSDRRLLALLRLIHGTEYGEIF